MRAVRVEPITYPVPHLAGIALVLVRGATAIDAIVMASASLRSETVYTSDVGDLTALRNGVAEFAGVQIARA